MLHPTFSFFVAVLAFLLLLLQHSPILSYNIKLSNISETHYFSICKEGGEAQNCLRTDEEAVSFSTGHSINSATPTHSFLWSLERDSGSNNYYRLRNRAHPSKLLHATPESSFYLQERSPTDSLSVNNLVLAQIEIPALHATTEETKVQRSGKMIFFVHGGKMDLIATAESPKQVLKHIITDISFKNETTQVFIDPSQATNGPVHEIEIDNPIPQASGDQILVTHLHQVQSNSISSAYARGNKFEVELIHLMEVESVEHVVENSIGIEFKQEFAYKLKDENRNAKLSASTKEHHLVCSAPPMTKVRCVVELSSFLLVHKVDVTILTTFDDGSTAILTKEQEFVDKSQVGSTLGMKTEIVTEYNKL